MRNKKIRYFMGDFETTVYKGQTYTEVWASALVELYTEDVSIFHSLDETFERLVSLNSHIVLYYHNLKFDGSFWLDFLINKMQYKQAFVQTSVEPYEGYFLDEKDMTNDTFKYLISDMGQWYSIVIKVKNRVIEIRDSLKLLPFSVKRIGKSFKTKHKKLDMEYKGFRYAGCEITQEEQEYIKNDVLVVKEALEIMFDEGHNSVTIGSCCLKEFKRTIGKEDYETFFPNLYEEELNPSIYGYKTAGDYVRKSYRGGWCYLVEGREEKIVRFGVTFDVNSLYPSMMSSESGNYYPVGKPCFWKGDYIPDKALLPKRYYFIRVKTRFYLKKGKLPFIQIKNSLLYRGTESLKTSDIYDKETGQYYSHYIGFDGQVKDTRVEMVLTMTDYQLIKEHYELVEFEILDGCWFYAEIGLFDDYIEKYKKQKQVSTGARRELAKLFLNNLYGKMATSTNSAYKVAYIKDDGVIGFKPVLANDKVPGYIPIGSAITSYARNFTIRAAQKNFHGADQRGFIYADTDSIHCDLTAEEIVGINIHDNDFCCWKPESFWDEAIFTRQKTYIEHITHENMEPIDKPYYNIKCAGMPPKCKDLFQLSMQGYVPSDSDEYTEEEIKFLSEKRELTDFVKGLSVPGKLLPKRIHGGIVLKDTTYEMR